MTDRAAAPEELRAAVIAAAERGLESLRLERKARRLLRCKALRLRVRDGAYTVFDPYSNSVPLGAPHRVTIEEVMAWIARGLLIEGGHDDE